MHGLPVEPGDVVADKYRIERLIGRGGMGSVFLATHTQILQRVALKFLSSAMLHREDVRARFLREARAAAALTSDHVARIFDVGVLPSGAPYLVSEYLDGRDLGARIDAGPMAVDDAVKLIMQACDALGEAHGLGIVHRDLKPHNLFLVKRPTGATLLKVLDFGIAKVEDPNLAADVVTGTCAVLGTPHYMAPEQMTSTRSVDPAADVWALGVVLYEMLTTKRPFESTTLLELGALVMSAPHTPITAYRTDIPAAVVALIDRCLLKDPTRRFADANELHAALAAIQQKNAIVAPPTLVTPVQNDPIRSTARMTPPTPLGPPTPRAPIPLTSVSFGESSPPPAPQAASRSSIAVPVVLACLVLTILFAVKIGTRERSPQNTMGGTPLVQVSAPPPLPATVDVPPLVPLGSSESPPPSATTSATSATVVTSPPPTTRPVKIVKPVVKPTTTSVPTATAAPSVR